MTHQGYTKICTVWERYVYLVSSGFKRNRWTTAWHDCRCQCRSQHRWWSYNVTQTQRYAQLRIFNVGVNEELSIGKGLITSIQLRSSQLRIFVDIIFHLVDTKHDFEGFLMKISGSGILMRGGIKFRFSQLRIFGEIIFHLVDTKHDFEGFLIKLSVSGILMRRGIQFRYSQLRILVDIIFHLVETKLTSRGLTWKSVDHRF